jgi:hypothetical protein
MAINDYVRRLSEFPPMPTLTLSIEQSGGDLYCCVAVGISATAECGKTQQEAIGAWVLAHGKDYGVAVEVD